MDGSAREHQDSVVAESMNAPKESPAIADMVSFIEDKASPMKCMKRRDMVEKSASLGLSDGVVGRNDNRRHGKVLVRDATSLRAMEDEGKMSASALESVDPLSNEGRRKDDECALAEVGDDEAYGGDGLTKPHFVADEPAANGTRDVVGEKLAFDGPADSVLLVWKCVERGCVSPGAELVRSSIELFLEEE